MAADYFETSALLKLYRPEVGSQKVEDIFRAAAEKPLVANLGVIELFSAFNRQVRKGTIKVADYRKFERRFLADLKSGVFDVLSLGDEHFNSAEQLIRNHGRKRECQAPDALHLALAISIRDAGDLANFVSSDRALLSLATAEGLPVINPEI
jgi:predicted nucleic acid-binding protein